MGGFRYTLKLADGSDAGEVEIAARVQVGDEIRLAGNRRARVLNVVPQEVVGEFVSRPLCGLLAITLLD